MKDGHARVTGKQLAMVTRFNERQLWHWAELYGWDHDDGGICAACVFDGDHRRAGQLAREIEQLKRAIG